MALDPDKYPVEDGRRRFVHGLIGSGVLASVGAGGAAAVGAATISPGGGGGPVSYIGIQNTAGPAHRGMPQIPLTLDDDGYLKGVWPEVKTTTVNGEETGSTISWAQYDHR